MAKKPYSWGEGATLDEHSKRKHKILREYFIQYLTTRCKNPQATKFRLAIIDGFCGAGRYKDGSLGSPLIFLEELKNTLEQINIGRAAEKMPSTEIECLLVFNDLDKGAVDQLRQNIAPLQAAIKDTCPKLHIQLEFYNDKFEEIYPAVKARIADAKYKSVLFNLDQCGYSYVNADIITDITSAWRSAEVFLTFPIETITAYISPDRTKNSVLNHDPKLLKQIYDVIKDGGRGDK
jgi:three-Cys-motif partner protein